MFTHFTGAVESYSKYKTCDWLEVTPHDVDTRAVAGIISIRQLN